MYATRYHRAASVKDAVKLLASSPDAKALSGGHTLIPTMKQRLASPSDLVDLRHIPEMKGVKVDGTTITIGAATCHADVANDKALKKACPGLANLASHIGDPHVRAMGTIGGSIANNDPAADYPSAMLALNATIHTNKRKIAADKFFKGQFDTALNDGEIITAVSFTKPAKAAYAKFANPASLYALAGVFVAKHADGARVAVTGAGSDGVFRHKGMEAALTKKWSAESLAGVAVEAKGLMGDMHASAEYRAALIKAMAKRAVAAA
jgi:aerobic carbon-monoxide dehydrogenase medium subunit